MLQIGIIDSHHRTIGDPDIERAVFAAYGKVQLFQVAGTEDLPPEAYTLDGLISWPQVPLQRAFLQDLQCCRGIVRAAVDVDNIDLATAAEHGIQVANVPDYGTEEVADHTLALALSLLRRLPRGHEVVMSGSWDWREVGELPRLRQLTVGLIGFGRIGMAVAQRFKAFGCRVCFYDPYVSSGVDKSLGVTRYESLDELLRAADLVSLHTPLNDETHHLLATHELALLKGKYLINTARGPLIDGEALCKSLVQGGLRGVGLDVYEDERRMVPPALQDQHNVILSPHVAFYSDAALPELRRKAAEVLLDILQKGGHRNVLGR
jgi:lactate dehydrogenase-like 2-hydroxyacid dehydrogenase